MFGLLLGLIWHFFWFILIPIRLLIKFLKWVF